MRTITPSLFLALVMSSTPWTLFTQTKELAVKDIIEWGAISEGFQLAIRTDTQAFSLGEPVWLSMHLKNTSNKTASAFTSVPWRDYMIDIRTEKGVPVSLTEETKVLEQQRNDDRPTSIIEMRLSSGEVVNDRLLLNKIYSLDRGSYSVIVKRRIPRLDKKGWTEVTSNTIKISVGS